MKRFKERADEANNKDRAINVCDYLASNGLYIPITVYTLLALVYFIGGLNPEYSLWKVRIPIRAHEYQTRVACHYNGINTACKTIKTDEYIALIRKSLHKLQIPFNVYKLQHGDYLDQYGNLEISSVSTFARLRYKRTQIILLARNLRSELENQLKSTYQSIDAPRVPVTPYKIELIKLRK